MSELDSGMDDVVVGGSAKTLRAQMVNARIWDSTGTAALGPHFTRCKGLDIFVFDDRC